ncbi:MAG: NUDIX domain-containing protein [Spirochaetes bacterium]|nr:NUDIX domain-containing protein [Spirochaetota bacterium]MBU0954609.1 NUDIX domain-containing protein [Spirochaetota bacterium]
MKKRSVAGIAISQGAVFVGKRLPGGDLGGKWEFPGGKCEAGENDVQALQREYLEEFAVDITVGEALTESAFVHNGHDYVLAAWAISLHSQNLVLSEHSEWAWVDADTLAALDLAESDRSLLPFVLQRLRDKNAGQASNA